MSLELLKLEMGECLIRAKSKETIDTLGYLMEFAENHLNNGWIGVDEKLPEPDKMVIIAVGLSLETPKICLGSYAKDDTPITDDEGNTYSYSHWWHDENDDFIWEFGEVKYWQPLPELPTQAD